MNTRVATQTRRRTAVVTGAHSGIGRATAALLASTGVRVIGVDVADGHVVADLGTPAGRAQALARIRELCDDVLDALVVCAGIAQGALSRVVAVNYFGATELALGLRPQLARGDAPRVTLVASSASLLPCDAAIVERCLAADEPGALAAAGDGPSTPERQGAVYAASKRALTRWIRRTAPRPEWAGAGILMNGVSPGLVRTPMTEPLLATEEGRAVLARVTPRAVAAPATPADVALLLAFLAGPDNRYLVGQVPFVDGGTDVLMRGDDVLG